MPQKTKIDMNKEEFLEAVNFSRKPEYTMEDVQEGTPTEDGVYIICTEKDNCLIGVWENEKWPYASFTSHEYGDSCYEDNITTTELTDKVVYYIKSDK